MIRSCFVPERVYFSLLGRPSHTMPTRLRGFSSVTRLVMSWPVAGLNHYLKNEAAVARHVLLLLLQPRLMCQ